MADAIERDRAARDERYASNGLPRSPYSDTLLAEQGAIYADARVEVLTYEERHAFD